MKHAMIFRAREIETLEHLRREHVLTPEGCCVRSVTTCVARAASLLGSEKSKPISALPAASDRNDVVSDEPRRDKETSIFSLYRSIVGALLYMEHDRSDAACAIRLSGCDLWYANEDSLRRF